LAFFFTIVVAYISEHFTISHCPPPPQRWVSMRDIAESRNIPVTLHKQTHSVRHRNISYHGQLYSDMISYIVI